MNKTNYPHTTPQHSALSVRHITKTFNTGKVLQGLSLDFQKGLITGVVGPNGSGKSTFINVLTGMYDMTSGEIIVLGKEKITRTKAEESASFGITRTFQEVRLFEQLSVEDNVLVTLTSRNWFKALFEKHTQFHLAQTEEVLSRVGLLPARHKKAVDLSYGQRKLLEIARVLAMRKVGKGDIIFFDEPFAGLFPEMIKIVVSIIKELRTQGATIILVEHNMELIRELSDYLYVFDSGTLLAEGDAGVTLARKDVVEAYLGE